MALTWYVDVDWNNDGTFEADEAAKTMALRIKRGRENMIPENGSGFERLQVGELTLTLDNDDGRFDPLNSASAIYPGVRPGREIRIRVNDGSTTYTVFRGKIKNIQPVGTKFNKRAVITAQDGWAFLGRSVRKAVQATIRTDAAIGHILDEADWPSAWGRSLATGSDYIPYWWADGNADELLHELTVSEQGQFYVAADGQATFKGRGAIYAGTSAVTLSGTDILNDIWQRQPWETVRNIVRVYNYPKTNLGQQTLWSVDEPIYINAGDEVSLVAEYQYNNRPVAAVNVVTPVSGTDYAANSSPDGSGTSYTGSLTVSFTDYGTKAFISLTNGAAAGVYVYLLQVRGDAIDTQNPFSIERENASSQTEYGPRLLTIDVPWQQNRYLSQDMAAYLLDALDAALPFPVIRMEDKPTIQFAHDLFARITLDVSAIGFNQDFYVGGIEHEWITPNGQGVLTTWHLEPVMEAVTSFWQFTTNIGTTSVFAY